MDVQPSMTRDMSVEQVAEEVQRSPSTIRRWPIAGELRGYKLQGRDWRLPRPALRESLAHQGSTADDPDHDAEVDSSAWRHLRRNGV
ncbi:MAG: helix-turn-helix domain-containing protein [Gemmatimonadota bacterium]|nr:helix-turn-helix domain-containing protein [Gemmatimonadota bacterium]